jgi:hypothetical protein
MEPAAAAPEMEPAAETPAVMAPTACEPIYDEVRGAEELFNEIMLPQLPEGLEEKVGPLAQDALTRGYNLGFVASATACVLAAVIAAMFLGYRRTEVLDG